MKELTIDDIHKVLLDLAFHFDKVCVENNIPYYMLGGTMLGAIRHKGFIPWDDDMDFGVPAEYMEKLESALASQLPSKYKLHTPQNSRNIFFPFAKFANENTILDDKQNPLPFGSKIGINIDIFPLYSCEEHPDLSSVINTYTVGAKIHTDSRTSNMIVKFIKRTIRFICPLSRTWFLNRTAFLVSKLNKGEYLANVYGRWQYKEICPRSWYGHGTRYTFNNISLVGFKEYDLYLKQMYGDYMQLPPEEKRFVHSEKAYIKE